MKSGDLVRVLYDDSIDIHSVTRFSGSNHCKVGIVIDCVHGSLFLVMLGNRQVMMYSDALEVINEG